MNNISFLKVDHTNEDFVKLVKALDKELEVRDGEDHAFYDQFNKIDAINHAVVLYANKVPVACGAIKPFEEDSMEVKRMYVIENQRKHGFGTKTLEVLEEWAKSLGYNRCVLETGIMQPEAIGLYEKSGYTVIENYGQYAGVKNSVCFEKLI